MSALRHVVHQGPMLRSLGRMAWVTLRQRTLDGGGTMQVPGPEYTEVVPPRDRELVRDYIRWAGGDPRAWRGRLPPHLWPQWGFPLLARALEGIEYPMAKVLNGGSRIESKAPLPDDVPLHLTAQLEEVDDDGRRALLTLRQTTHLPDGTEAVVAHLFAYVPLKRGDGDKKKRKQKALVPDDAREIGWWKLPEDAGLQFACLTGDFNPVHWVPPYARAAGFRNTILHGFATEAKAIETMNRILFAGDPARLRTVEVRFTRPLQLPARVGCYVRPERDDAPGEVYVGQAPGGPAYLTGTWTTRD